MADRLAFIPLKSSDPKTDDRPKSGEMVVNPVTGDFFYKIPGSGQVVPSGVHTVNGKRRDADGNVVLGASDVAALPISGGHVQGEVYATAFNTESRRELKTDIAPFGEDALLLLDSVEVVSFKYKSDEKGVTKVGFIADDTHELLSGPDRDAMHVDSAIGVLIKAMQELHRRVSELEKELALTRTLG